MEEELYAGYAEEIQNYRLTFSRGWAYIAMALIVAGNVLDYALYPELQLLFCQVRVLTAILIFCVILVTKTQWGRSHGHMLTFVWLMFPQFMISWMIYKTDGAFSLYYAGLHLAIVASGVALPVKIGENLLFSASTYLMYVAACTAHPGDLKLSGPFAVNSMLFFMIALVCALGSYFNDKVRMNFFRLRAEIAEKNRQLEGINKRLAQIKGQMLQQEKMAAIGTLAAGLLHEVNNPVNFCLMAIDLAAEERAAKSSELLMECLTDAREGMQRVQGIVSDLKIFAYRQPDTTEHNHPFLFEKALNSAERLTGHELRGIRVTRDLPSDTLVHGDEAAIVGVMINLLSNASVAMRKAGSPAPSIHIKGTWKGTRLLMSVLDSGPGISPQNLSRVFEPFFTTREVGQGLGLGLAISYSVIERHGGILTATSELGKWTEMTFDLPREE